MAGDLWRTLAAVVDVLVVAVVFYSLLLLARGTRAWQIMWGLIILAGIFLLSDLLQLRTLHWLVRQVVPLAPVALVILFYPELRYALEEVGRVQFWRSRLPLLPSEDLDRLIDEVVKMASNLSQRRVGALVVIEREEGLDDLIVRATHLDAEVSSELLETVFHPGTTLHDGAVIIRGNRAVAAGCLLPLTDRPTVGSALHTRHRAAIGVTERSDALAVVVSEETGAISLGMEGELERGLTPQELRERLKEALAGNHRRHARPLLWPVAGRRS